MLHLFDVTLCFFLYYGELESRYAIVLVKQFKLHHREGSNCQMPITIHVLVLQHSLAHGLAEAGHDRLHKGQA